MTHCDMIVKDFAFLRKCLDNRIGEAQLELGYRFSADMLQRFLRIIVEFSSFKKPNHYKSRFRKTKYTKN